MSRIIPALLTFLAVVGLADWLGWGQGYLGLLALAGWLFAVRALTENGVGRLLTAAIAFSALIAAFSVMQIFVMPRARGPFISPNALGSYAVLMVFLVLSLGSHFSLATKNTFATISLLSLALSQSRGAILALGTGFAVWAFTLLRREFHRSGGVDRSANISSLALAFGSATFFLSAAIVIVLEIRTGAGEARVGIWLVALQAASQRLVLGYGQNGLWISGLGSFYSIPIQWLANAGIPGVLAGGWLIFEGFRAARGQPWLLAFLAAWFVQGLFFFSTPATSIMLFGVLGYLAKTTHAPKANQSANVMPTIQQKPSGWGKLRRFFPQGARIRRPGYTAGSRLD